jgi:DNA-binding transcriptional ArsR family regulator
MHHGAAPNRPVPVGPHEARIAAQCLQALASPTRLLILARLRSGPCSVGELAEAVEMEQSAVSHQLRMLRHLGLVVSRRVSRQVFYALHDAHVAELIDQALFHVEHLRRSDPEPIKIPA